MRGQYDIVIGIDPDCDRSGVAVLDVRGRELEVFCMEFAELVQHLTCAAAYSIEGGSILVVVEASWNTQANWHGGGRNHGGAYSASLGYDVGRNHETGRKISEMAKAYGLEVEEKRPLRKCWKGKDGKITHGELVSLLDGSGVRHSLGGRSNQEERDAALLALDASGIAMRMKVKGGAV